MLKEIILLIMTTAYSFILFLDLQHGILTEIFSKNVLLGKIYSADVSVDELRS